MKVLNIAAANGGVHGKDKAEMAEKMTKKQIAKAQDLSREMIEANPKLMGD
jgi:protein subunit release factor B